MLTLGLAFLVLGIIGLALGAVRRVWPAAMPWRRILLVELGVLAAWLVGGNVLATWREGQAERAWAATLPKAVPPVQATSVGPNAAGLELVKLASGMGIHLGRARGQAAASPGPDPASQSGMAKLSSFVDSTSRQMDDVLTAAPTELLAWLILEDEASRAVEKHLLEGGPIDWGGPADDDGVAYSPFQTMKLHAVVVTTALERMRAGDPAGAATALQAASTLTASLRDRPDTFGRLLALSQDRRLLGALRILDPVSPGWESLVDEIDDHTRPLGALSSETLELLAEARKPFTTIRGLIFEMDAAAPIGEGPRRWLSGLWLTLSGGHVPLEGRVDEAAAERRRTSTPFHRYVQGPLEKPYLRLVVADHAMAQAQDATAAGGSDACGLEPPQPAARRAPWSLFGETASSFIPRLARSTAALRVELELTRLVLRARSLRALSPKREWPAQLPGAADSRACPGRRFVSVVEAGHAQIRLEPNGFGEKEATVSFRMAGR